MGSYVMTTRISPDALQNPKSFEELGRKVIDKIRSECPDVTWKSSYSVLGPYDYVDVFEAPDNETAQKVSVIIRSFGHASTEIWPAASWGQFRDMIQQID